MAKVMLAAPHLVMMQALESELLPGRQPLDPPWGDWAREVKSCLQESDPQGLQDAEALLATAARALASIFCSEYCQFLLDDALARPRAFGRTLLLMLEGGREAGAQPEPGSAGLH